MPGRTPPGRRLLVVAATWVILVLVARAVPARADLVLAVGGAAAVAATAAWAGGRRRCPRAPTPVAWGFVLAVGFMAWALALLTLLVAGAPLHAGDWAVVLGLPAQYLLLLRAGL